MKVDKVGNPGKKDFPIPDEALRLFRKLAEADVPCNQKEVDFMEAWCLGSTAQPAWKKRPLKREPIEDLARATAQAYHHDGEKLSALASVLCAFAECDGPVIDQQEKYALSWTKYGLAGKRNVNASRFKSPQHPPPVPPQFRRETTSTLPKKSLPKKGDKPPINLSVRSGLVGGYVLKVRNMSQKRMSLHIESMHWPDEDIKADITLEGTAEMEVGWMEVNAARNFRAGETGTISSSHFTRALKFSITNSGGLRMS